MEKISTFLQKCVKYGFTMMMAGILLLCQFNKEIHHAVEQVFLYRNTWYLALGIVCILALGWMLDRVFCGNPGRRKEQVIMLGLNFLLLLYMLFSTYHYYFKMWWDAGTVIEQAKLLAYGDLEWLDHAYYSRCSNNFFITILFSWVIRFGELFGIGNYYYYLTAFVCVLWAAAGYMIYFIADTLCEKKSSAVLAWILYVLLMGFSPWVTVPYTDSVAVFFLVGAVFLYTNCLFGPSARKGIRGLFSWVLLGFCLTVGYYIKPHVVVLVIAFVLLHIWELSTYIRRERGLFVKQLTAFIIGLLCGLLLVKGSIAASPYEIEPGREYQMPHYLMQGMNYEHNGVFDTEDVLYSESFPTQEERNQKDLELALQRLRAMGPVKYVQHLGRKLMAVYGDGAFAWGLGSTFFAMKFYSGIRPVQEFYWSFFFPDGEYYNRFLNERQTLWMGILFFAIFAVKGKKEDRNMTVLALAVIGVTLLELLLEPNSRHLLIYVPVLIVMACRGYENICALFRGGRRPPAQAKTE